MNRDDDVGYKIVIQTAERMIEQNQRIIRGHEARIRKHKESIVSLRKNIEVFIIRKRKAIEAMEAWGME